MHASCLILLTYFTTHNFGIRQGRFQLWNWQALCMQAVHLLITFCAVIIYIITVCLVSFQGKCLVLYLLEKILKSHLKCKQNISPLPVLCYVTYIVCYPIVFNKIIIVMRWLLFMKHMHSTFLVEILKHNLVSWTIKSNKVHHVCLNQGNITKYKIVHI